MKAWLIVIGIDDCGISSLSRKTRDLILNAEIIFGGKRHLSMLPSSDARKISWKSPIIESIEDIKVNRGKLVCVLATGDPMWFGIGAMLTRFFDRDEMMVFPAKSVFSLAASIVKWPLEECRTLTLHARPSSSLVSSLYPGAKLFILSENSQTPAEISSILCTHGFGHSNIYVMEHLGGEHQRVRKAKARNFGMDDIADLNMVAVECCKPDYKKWKSCIPGFVPGLEDNIFNHDGQITKAEVRAATLSALAPHPGACLWDIGAGSGSISIEWMRAVPHSFAIAVEQSAQRLKQITVNAQYLGVPSLKVVFGRAPDILQGLQTPDAIFIGGGITDETLIEYCWKSLPLHGRIVANVVTVEGEEKLVKYHRKFGGSMTRIAVSRAAPVGKYLGWRPLMSVTQWKAEKLFKRNL